VLVAHGQALRALYWFAEAETALTRALELFMEIGDIDHEIGVRGTLGTMYNVSGRAELAVPVLEQAMTLLPAGTSIRTRGQCRR
jgi:hypothetical protein